MKAVVLTLVAMAIGSSALAYGRHDGRRGGYNNGHRDGYHDGYHDGRRNSNDGFADGVLVGLVASTSALFLSEITADRQYAVYMNADNDAADFLAQGGEATPALKQAMKYERGFLAKAQVAGSDQLSDEQVAAIVLERSNSLK